MNEKQMTQQESLAIITKMIAMTQRKMEQSGGGTKFSAKYGWSLPAYFALFLSFCSWLGNPSRYFSSRCC